MCDSCVIFKLVFTVCRTDGDQCSLNCWYIHKVPADLSQCIISFRTLQNIHDVHHSPVLYRVNVEVDKPAQRVLVHWVYVGQISNAEEQDGGVLGNGSVTLSGLCNLDLCLFCNLGNT